MSLAHMILNAMVIGALGSLPVGPIVVMTFQKSLCYGRKAGMACASGAIASDTVFAAIALFAYSLISNLLLEYSKQIEIIGGLVIVIMGGWPCGSRSTSSSLKHKVSAAFFTILESQC